VRERGLEVERFEAVGDTPESAAARRSDSMALAAGHRLGSYEVLELIGAGGMGEVHRARDTRLHRDVAIKVLPDARRLDSEALQRFEREARLLASLNHPNIATLHGLETAGGVQALVMELVDGETLEDRLVRAPGRILPLGEALHVAKQIADALDAAHERGVVHRDLKPANVKIRSDGTVKVLDFGIAKVFDSQAGVAGDATLGITAMQAAIIGTPSYMSPEQASGGPIDRRADIWAFGCVLYQMLAGERAFEGDTASSTLARVLEREPDWSKLPVGVPRGLRVLLQQCLEKNPRKRRRDCGDVKLDLEQVLADPHASEAPGASARDRIWQVATALLALATVGLLALQVYPRGTAPAAPAVRFAVSAPPGGTFATSLFAGSGSPVGGTLSPDGRQIAFTARDAGGTLQLYVRELDSLDARALPGTQDAALPFWSPDSDALAFFTTGQLKRIDVDGDDPPQTLCGVTRGQGGAWSPSGTIVFAANLRSGLHRVSATGGDCGDLTQLAGDELAHRFPHFLPDGEHFIYHVNAAQPAEAGIFVAALGAPVGRRLLAADSAVFAPPQHVLFVRQGTLFAQELDAEALALVGEPKPLVQDVSAEGSAPSFSASNTGALSYRTGPADSEEQQLVWFDRMGARLSIVDTPGTYRGVDLSPDGTRIAVHNHRGNGGDIWIFEPEGTTTRVTFDPTQDNSSPIWSPDGKRVAFGSLQNGQWGLYAKAANGEGRSELLFESAAPKIPASWSPDGGHLAYWLFEGVTHQWLLPAPGSGSQPFRMFDGTNAYDGHSQVSPDGRWVAYMATQTGRPEIYVRPFPTGEGARQVSSNGGVTPRWRRDGKEIYFMTSYEHGTMMAAPIETDGTTLSSGVPEALFGVDMAIVPHSTLMPNFHTYAVTPDGQRFVMPLPVSRLHAGGGTPITVVISWTALLAD
jgi:Tol biopolymer transport system component/tRNA A-37 threonylcarbamoyl transferase component Bud32